MKNLLFLIISCSFLFSNGSCGKLDVKQETCIGPELRIDCHPDPNPNEENCIQRGCTWCEEASTPAGAAKCYLKADHGYVIDGDVQETPNGMRVNLRKISTSSYFGDDAVLLSVYIDYQSDYRLRIRITDDEDRFEVPLTINPPEHGIGGPETRLYEVEIVRQPLFGIKIKRKSTGLIVFDTTIGGLTFSEHLHQIAIKIPDGSNAYGIGENEQKTLKHDFGQYQTFPLWARDQAPDGNLNMYGVQPYYQVIEDMDGNSHSVMFLNANAQEFQLVPQPAYIYRTIGGILDLFLYFGPKPEDCARQMSEAVGRQQIPPYWALGFQLSRWGYDSIENMKAAVDRTSKANIPHDIQYGDIDYMRNKLDFTVDDVNFAGLGDYVKELKERGIKFIPILDTFIDFDELDYPPLSLGNEMDVWIKNGDGNGSFEGHVWPGRVFFPDYFKENTSKWWIDEIVKFKDLLDFDGLWIDMNEPANWAFENETEIFCPDNTINNPRYVPNIGRNRKLQENTICADTLQKDGEMKHFDLHSLYGLSSVIPTHEGMRIALQDKRGIVVTRSTYLGSGRYTAHWLGDNWSEWSNLHTSVIGMVQFNMWGMPYVGADICGFIGNATEELCERWMELGAFYPYARNHNIRDQPDQDPGMWESVSISSKKALEIRYTLLPYLYSLFYKHRLHGDTVIRPLWNEFAKDATARNVDTQFMWGSSIMISPVLTQNTFEVDAYFPDNRWYDYENGIELSARGATVKLETPRDKIQVHVRGGYVIPTQGKALNTQISRNNPFGLIIALDDNDSAQGFLYFDDGDSIEPQESGNYFEAEYNYTGGVLTGKVLTNGYSLMVSKRLGNIRIFGAKGDLRKILVDGYEHTDYTISNVEGAEIKIFNLFIPMTHEFHMDLDFLPNPTTTTELPSDSSTTLEPGTSTTTDETNPGDGSTTLEPGTSTTTAETNPESTSTTTTQEPEVTTSKSNFLIGNTIYTFILALMIIIYNKLH